MKKLSAKTTKLDKDLVTSAKDIKVLSKLAWSPDIAETFLSERRKGNLTLPKVKHKKRSYEKEKAALSDVMSRCDRLDPIENFLYKTARSYTLAAEMIENVGTPLFTQRSIDLYGEPSGLIGKGPLSHLDAARTFIQATDEFNESCDIPDEQVCILAQTVADDLQKRADEVFTGHRVEIVLDPTLTSKAAAGSKRVRIRSSTCFSSLHAAQLAEHECFVHSLTALNGRQQPQLTTLGLGAPRTTRTQEGIAIFAELITGVIDLNRIRRLALRVEAVQSALDGANFIEIFDFFLQNGQSEFEAVQSASRVFRGGDVGGNVVFTKDAAYLAGLTEVHTFLRKAIKARKLDYPHYLCAGRLTLSDVITLEEYFKSGLIAMPRYEPSWIKNRPCLAAFLMYSIFLNRINLKKIELEDFIEEVV